MAPPKKPSKSKKRKIVPYSDEDLKKALFEIRTNKKGIRETAREFGVPRTTLQERLSGKRGDGVFVRGPDPVLGAEGERTVKDWLINNAICGLRVKKSELLDTVQKIVKDRGTKNPFKDNRPGETWYKKFLKRHPDLTYCISEGINKARASATEESIKSWFSELETFLIETNNHDIIECPERIFNGDEYGFSVCPKTGEVWAPKGYRNTHQIKSDNEKENLSVLVTFNASGQMCPPLVVFPYVRPPRAVVESIPEDWCLGKSENGWMRADVFLEFVTNHFNNWVNRNNIKKPILLLVDGYRSPLSLVLSAMSEKQGIILYALPPNTTHMQPADISVFAPFKSSWNIIVRNFLSKPDSKISCVTKTNFCKFFQDTLNDTNMLENIKNGFKTCGLYPFNPNSVDYTKCVQSASKYVRGRTTNNCDEICNEDLIITKKVLKYLRPVLEKKKINVSFILKEIRKLKKPEESSESTETESEEDSTGNPEDSGTVNLSSSFQIECSTDGTNTMFYTSKEPLGTLRHDATDLPINQANTHTGIKILQLELLNKAQDENEIEDFQTKIEIDSDESELCEFT